MIDETTTAGPDRLDEGVALVIHAEDGGDWKPVIEWLARHPICAAELASFLAAQRGLKAVVAPLAAPTGMGRIPGLELQEEIGRGAMGVVYRAHDSTLKRDVAVKFVSALGEADRARFRFEAEAAAGMNHPNVVSVLSFGEAEGVPYLVMPCLSGGSLARWLHERGPDRLLSPERAVELVRGVALGIHHAHQRGLIHRDLKPGNVLLDEQGQPCIADFGLARPVDASMTGAAGTPAYMAPEQARGDKRLTTAVDIHALGVLLFELLTGQTPFGSEKVVAVLRRIEEEPPPPLRSLRADVSADLESICRRCLEKRPEDRYASAQSVADDLGRFLAGEPVSGQQRGVVDDVRRATERLVATRGMVTWPFLFFGAVNSTLSLAAVQVAVLMDAPRWVGWAALASYFVGWLSLLWALVLRHRHALNTVERTGLAIQFGMKAAAFATLPAQAYLHNGAIAPVFAPLFVVVGLGLFISGGTFWGRLYFVGLLELGIAALLPLVPVNLWPGLYCLTQLATQVWLGWHVWRIDRQSRRANQDDRSPSEAI